MSAPAPKNKSITASHTKATDTEAPEVTQDGVPLADGPTNPILGESGVWGAEDALDRDVEVLEAPTGDDTNPEG